MLPPSVEKSFAFVDRAREHVKFPFRDEKGIATVSGVDSQDKENTGVRVLKSLLVADVQIRRVLENAVELCGPFNG